MRWRRSPPETTARACLQRLLSPFLGSCFPDSFHLHPVVASCFRVQPLLHASDGDGETVSPRVAWIPLLQWPAMIVTVLSTWLVASQEKRRRSWGFWLFLLSNALWIVWGWNDHAYALVVLQFALAFLNIRGVAKNEPP